MSPIARFTVSSQPWLKVLIVTGTLAFAGVAFALAEAGFKSSDIRDWITAAAATASCVWLVAVGARDIRYFSVEIHVEPDRVIVATPGGSRNYPLEELKLRTRPISNSVELSHAKDGCLFVADMYATNANELVRLFERRFTPIA